MNIIKSTTIFLAVAAAMTATAKVKKINDVMDLPYSERPIIIEVYASWCGPCRTYSPIFERIGKKYSKEVEFYKIDIDNPKSEDFLNRYDITSVPTTVIILDEAGDAIITERIEHGLLNESELDECVQYALINQYRYRSTMINYGNSWEPDIYYDRAIQYTRFPVGADRFIGEWQGVEDNAESRLFIFKLDNELYFVGGTASDDRENLFETKWWDILYMDWTPETKCLIAYDVLPDTPTNIFGDIKSGKIMMREFRCEGDKIVASVTTFTAKESKIDWNNPIGNSKMVYNRIRHFL